MVASRATSELFFASALAIAIDGPTVDTQYSQLNVSGQVNLSGVKLVISGGHQPAASESFVIVSNDGTDSIDGEFVDLPEGALVIINGGAYPKRITYVGGDGNDVELRSLPPSTPVDVDGTTNSVPENSPNGTLVGLTARSETDPPGGTVIYLLLSDASGRFAIDNVSGVVTVANGNLLDFESATGHTIIVEARYGDFSLHETFTIAVSNAAPVTPFDFDGTSPNNVTEQAASGTAVGLTVLAFDPAGGLVTYSLSDNAGGRFSIDSDTGIVTVLDGSLLDYETNTSHTITVVASDGLLTSSADFTINVLNINEALALEVQTSQSQRSFIRTVDVLFESEEHLDDVVDLALGRVLLERFALSGAGAASSVNLTGVVSRIDSQVRLDFGLQGIGGNRNTTAGDGYYRLSIDLDGDGSFETVKHFYRLLGDVNGDRQVSTVDASLILASYGTSNPERDVNGDGLVNAADRTLAIRSLGQMLNPLLPLDD